MVNESVEQLVTTEQPITEINAWETRTGGPVEKTKGDKIFEDIADTQSIVRIICEYINNTSDTPDTLRKSDPNRYRIERKITLPDFRTTKPLMPGLSPSDLELVFIAENYSCNNAANMFNKGTITPNPQKGTFEAEHGNVPSLLIRATSKELPVRYFIGDNHLRGRPNSYSVTLSGTDMVSFYEEINQVTREPNNRDSDRSPEARSQANKCYDALTRAILHHILDSTKAQTKDAKVEEIPTGEQRG